MNRKKALYRYEFGNMKWMLVAGLGCCLVVLFIINATYSQIVDFSMEGESYFELGYGATFSEILLDSLDVFTVMAVIAVSVMTIFQFSDYHKRNRREYIVSLPFTQRERFVSKFVVGSGILTVVCAAFGVGVSLLRVHYYDFFLKRWLTRPEYRLLCGNDTWFHTLRSVLLLWVVVLTVYAISTVIHSLVTSGVVASVISIGLVASPLYLLWMIYFYGESFNPDFYKWELLNGTIAQVCGSLVGTGYCKTHNLALEMEQTNDAIAYGNYTDYGSMGLVFLVLFLIFVTCVILAYVINIRQDGAKFGSLIPIKGARIFIGAGMAVCFAFPLAMIAEYCLAIEDSAWGLLILQIILAAVLYSVSQRIFRRVTR